MCRLVLEKIEKDSSVRDNIDIEWRLTRQTSKPLIAERHPS